MDPDSIRVLHVDDDPDFGDLTATVLEREDERFVVETATTATEGLDSMWDRPPDCIVSDYDMPELDGIEFLERVREEYPEMPFILFTGKGSESVASQAISAGVTDYLEKNDGLEQYTLLANRISNAVTSRRTSEALTEARNRHQSLRTELLELSIELFQSDDTDVATRIERALRRLGTHVSADRTYVFQIDQSARTTTNTHEWCADGVTPQIESLQDIPFEAVPWWIRQLENFDTITIPTVSDLPDEASGEREILEEQNISSLIVAPMISNEELVGFVGFDWIEPQDVWEQEFVDILRIAARLITSALQQDARRQEIAHISSQYQSLVENFPNGGVLLFNDDLEIIRAGGAELDAVGLASNEVEGTVLTDSDDIAGEHEQYFKRTLTGERHTYRLESDGVHYEIRTIPVQTGVDDSTCGMAVLHNVTAQRKQQQKLERNRDLLRHTQELASVGGWEADVETGEQTWTRETYEIHDIDPDSEFDPTVEGGIDYYHPEDRAAIETAIENCRTYGEAYDLELRLITAEDEEKWVRTVGAPVYDGDDISKIRGAIQDITARKQRETELRRYEQLVESSPELFVVMDEQMSVTYQSPPSPIAEWEPMDVTGENPLEHIHPDDQDEVIRLFTRVIEHPSQISAVEFRARDADGDWRWIESRAQNLTDDPIGGVLAVMREVTQRKQQEQQLERYSTSLEQLHAVSQRLLETTDSEEAAQRLITGIETVFAVDLGTVWLSTGDENALKPVASTERSQELLSDIPTYAQDAESLSWEAYQQQELRYIADMSDHDQRLNEDTPIESEVIVPLGRHGLLNIGAAESDAFTEQDIELIELWSNTLTVVLERITQLELLQEREAELTRERDRLDEFTGVVSHDLRNPLNVAQGRAELAGTECDSEHLPKVTQALARMEALMEDSLELARQGEVVGETTTVDLADLATRCWETVPTNGATLEIADPPAIQADVERLPAVLENLFRNAVEHGGETVTITVGATESGFYVADDGSGIPAEKRSEVFTGGYTTDEDGTGFGLAIVKQICEAHGWEVTATESDTGGARFEITNVDLGQQPT